ncbi:hypothetical protein TNCV_1918001 [Trichonephila clavipes]|uniref:Uncharacterized protein n=1 Tax=Trichonephila clavipes TaxID=2585209 RepID=A0A8X6W0Z4_TRICX|nr:hypothetical protein TNCV_1918001 [Trichonephila clavipes]
MDSNHESENKLEKSDEHETFDLKEDSQMLSKELHQKRDEIPSVPRDTLHPIKKRLAREIQHAICRSPKDNKTTII